MGNRNNKNLRGMIWNARHVASKMETNSIWKVENKQKNIIVDKFKKNNLKINPDIKDHVTWFVLSCLLYVVYIIGIYYYYYHLIIIIFKENLISRTNEYEWRYKVYYCFDTYYLQAFFTLCKNILILGSRQSKKRWHLYLIIHLVHEK